jgi:uncharacterized protein (DUF433 family)
MTDQGVQNLSGVKNMELLDRKSDVAYDVIYNIRNEVFMTRYALNLPNSLKRDAERLAKEQGVSLNQFILWSVAEKVGGLLQDLDDSNFPNVTYRRGASGSPTPVLRGTGIRIQTIVIASEDRSPAEIGEDYDLTKAQIEEALSFYKAHRAEIDAFIQADAALEPKNE